MIIAGLLISVFCFLTLAIYNSKTPKIGQVTFCCSEDNLVFTLFIKPDTSNTYILQRGNILNFQFNPGTYNCFYRSLRSGTEGTVIVDLKDRDILKVQLPPVI